MHRPRSMAVAHGHGHGTEAADAPPEHRDRSWAVLIAVCLAQFMVTLTRPW